MSGDTPPGEPNGQGARVCVARIAGAYGVRGEVRLMVFTEDRGALATLGPFTDAAGLRGFALTALRAHGEGVVARFAEIASREDADALARHRPLHPPRPPAGASRRTRAITTPT